MKKTLSILILCVVTIAACGQQIKPGIKLGLTNALFTENINGQKGTTGKISNIDLAAYLEFDRGNFSIQPGLAYFIKGALGDAFFSASGNQISTNDLLLYYIELPVSVMYNFHIKGGKFFIGTGPYIAAAVAGTSTVYTTNFTSNSQNKTTYDVHLGRGQSDLQRFDYGVNVLCGFRFKNGIDLGVAYGIGLANLSNYSGQEIKNLTGSINLGYFFR